MYQAYQKKKKARVTAQRQAENEFAKEQNRLTREIMAEKTRRLREEEQLEKAQARQTEQQEREQLRREAQAKREADQALREQARRAAQAEHDLKQRQVQQERYHARLTVEQRRAEAEAKTATVRKRIEKLDRLLIERARGLKVHSSGAESVFNSHGASAFVDAIHTALKNSIYPERFRDSLAALEWNFIQSLGSFWLTMNCHGGTSSRL
jgi:chromosome segregation ATPase